MSAVFKSLLRCQACKGRGWLLFQDNTVQRYNECQRYPGDLEAAIEFFKSDRGRKFALKDITYKLLSADSA